VRRAGALLPLTVVLGLCGCALNPQRAPHTAPLEPGALGLAGEDAPAIANRWWQAYGDPRLDALVAQATRGNPSLADALARLERARADAGAAAAARGLRVDATASESRERFSATYVIPPPYGGGSYWDGQVNVGLSYELDFWGRQSARIRAVDRLVDARALDARAAELALQGAVVTGYVELERCYALADLARAAEETRQRIDDLTRRRVAAGLDSGIELRAAQSALPEARADREQASAAIELGMHRLAALTGQGARSYAAIDRPQLTYEGAPPLPTTLPGDLLARRPDVRAALARVRAASAGEDAARLAAYPDINLNAFAGFAALTLRDLLTAPARTYGLGPAIRLPIFDSGLLRAQYRGAGADLESAVARYNGTVLDAVREAADAITAVGSLGRELEQAAERVALLVEARRLAGERYHGGLTGQLASLEADARVIAARRAFVTTRALEAEARVQLLVALGGGDQPATADSPSSAKALP
jgi:NodT family efflux transporter outer membrane factor (OMF) lipoprotein